MGVDSIAIERPRLSRRAVLAGLGAGVTALGQFRPFAAGAAVPAGNRTVYLTSYRDMSAGEGARYGMAGMTDDGTVLFRTPLPGRGHAVMPHPTRPLAVVFQRRPGRWLVPIDLTTGQTGRVERVPDDRRTTGHGLFSADGRTLFVVEDDVPGEVGVIAVYDTAAENPDDWKRVGTLPTHGIGPHEAILVSGGTVLAVGNGGVLTHPDTGRAKLNLDEMDASLTFVAVADGRLVDKLRLPEEHSNLGIRHLAALPDGSVAFGTQDEHPVGMLQPLMGNARPGGPITLYQTPDDVLARLDGYIGSVAVNADGTVVAGSSPRGGLTGLWDATTGAFLGSRPLPDGCGLATHGNGFILTGGFGGVVTMDRGGAAEGERTTAAYGWDNHLMAATMPMPAVAMPVTPSAG